MVQILKKELIRKVVDNREFIENEYHKAELLTDNELEELNDHYEDPEDSINAGVYFDHDGDIHSIDIDSLLDSLEDYIGDCDEDDRITEKYIAFNRILRKIIHWKGFTLWT